MISIISNGELYKQNGYYNVFFISNLFNIETLKQKKKKKQQTNNTHQKKQKQTATLL